MSNSKDPSESVFLDGQTRQAIIDALPRLHGKLIFSFRPMTFEEVEKSEMALSSVSSRQIEAKISAVVGTIAKRVIGWNADRPVNADSIRMLHPRLVNRMYLIVIGRDGGDAPERGESTTEEYDEYTRELLEAGESGKSVSQVHEEATVKN